MKGAKGCGVALRMVSLVWNDISTIQAIGNRKNTSTRASAIPRKRACEHQAAPCVCARRRRICFTNTVERMYVTAQRIIMSAAARATLV